MVLHPSKRSGSENSPWEKLNHAQQSSAPLPASAACYISFPSEGALVIATCSSLYETSAFLLKQYACWFHHDFYSAPPVATSTEKLVLSPCRQIDNKIGNKHWRPLQKGFQKTFMVDFGRWIVHPTGREFQHTRQSTLGKPPLVSPTAQTNTKNIIWKKTTIPGSKHQFDLEEQCLRVFDAARRFLALPFPQSAKHKLSHPSPQSSS